MSRNMGTTDRAIRIVAGLVLVALAIAGVVGAWGYIGIVPLLTGVIGACPAYSLFGISTCSNGAATVKKF